MTECSAAKKPLKKDEKSDWQKKQEKNSTANFFTMTTA
jgi:hypothetical protein